MSLLAMGFQEEREVSDLYGLQGFIRQVRKLDGYRSKAHSSRKLYEARILGKMDKCDISETYVNIDRA